MDCCNSIPPRIVIKVLAYFVTPFEFCHGMVRFSGHSRAFMNISEHSTVILNRPGMDEATGNILKFFL